MLCGLAMLTPYKENIAKCELRHFSRLTVPQLMAFVRAHYAEATQANTFKDLKKLRTALKDAKDGVKNLLSAAYNVRHIKS